MYLLPKQQAMHQTIKVSHVIDDDISSQSLRWKVKISEIIFFLTIPIPRLSDLCVARNFDLIYPTSIRGEGTV